MTNAVTIKQLQWNCTAYSNSYIPHTIRDWNTLEVDPLQVESVDSFRNYLNSAQPAHHRRHHCWLARNVATQPRCVCPLMRSHVLGKRSQNANVQRYLYHRQLSNSIVESYSCTVRLSHQSTNEARASAPVRVKQCSTFGRHHGPVITGRVDGHCTQLPEKTSWKGLSFYASVHTHG